MNETKVWLVTGCSTGFGRHIATALLNEGERVVVTARKTQQIEDLAALGDALVLPLDVTDPAQAMQVVDASEHHFGRVDVLINNAGIGYFSSVEDSDDEAVRRMFEVNYFGTAHMIRAVLPGMRKRRAGMIVNLTSIGGLVGFEAVGHYCATKFAVEGLSESLRAEVSPLGIGVMTVQPSAFRTQWAGASGAAQTVTEDYQATAGAAMHAYQQSVGNQAGDPARAAAAIYAAVSCAAPPARLLLGNEAYEAAQAKLAAMGREFSAWESTARGADFPTA
ncbi:SDR family NAD(P)-dependent oxidoreductase [Pseudomonas moraviensis subsp. stanleyae]|uniref:oxidoreductase n=1 Tax=Pseudomonas moraviensis TaxID=321662 RepID=UPI002E3063EA|nr:oxidoreductase [Pseudomonas moraviensis]MED7669946.1 SDR family NAD(P)-dependent oxidoreductase [Pseudomonas moraviensis subsp. stanleyae]